MRIIEVQYENFKNIKDGKYELNGKSVMLLADNTLGKTNFMRGLQYVLGVKPAKNLIKEGTDKSIVHAVLAKFKDDQPIDDTVHTFKMVVKRVKGDEKVALQVTMPDGEKRDQKTFIGSLVGEIDLGEDFVKLSNTAEGRRKQLEIVKSYLDQETIESLTAMKNKLKITYDERTEVGRERDRLKTIIESTGLKFADFNKYKAKKDVKALSEKILTSSNHNTEIGDVKNRLEQRTEDIKKEKEALEKLKKNIEELETKNTKAKEWLTNPENAEVDVAHAQGELAEITEHNIMVTKVGDSNKWKKELDEQLDRYGDLTALHDSSQQLINDSIRDLVHPIPGLSFDEDDKVYFNGKLVNEDTLSFAESKLVNISLLRAKNPNAKVLFISNGESIGKKYLQEIQKFAKEEGYQVIMEQVQRGQEELKIEMMENY